MNFSNTNNGIEHIRKELEQRLSSKRFRHSCLTAELAVKYAKSAGYDEKKAELAGLMHDVAREYTNEQMDEAAKKYGVRLTRYNFEFPPSIHGLIGAAVAENEFGISDKEILDAIRNHVSGRPCMKMLEKIIFVADHISRNMISFPDQILPIYDKPIDGALFHTLRLVIDYDVENGRKIDERTAQTFDWLVDKINNSQKIGQYDEPENEWKNFFTGTDELISLYKKQMIGGFPAKNMRELGGYMSSDGRCVRKNKIIRSGNLNKFTRNDFDRLISLGINYAVDLRTDREKSLMSTENIPGLNYINIPFDVHCDFLPYLDSLFEWYERCEDPEEAAWLATRYSDSFNIDTIYRSWLFDENTSDKFKTILEIMMCEDCTGVIVFCDSGKDRTGIVSSVIMHSLGINRRTVYEDYMASQIPNLAVMMDYWERMRKEKIDITVRKNLLSVLGVESERPARLNNEIIKKYGNYHQYFNIDNYFSPDKIQGFLDKYLQ